MTELEERVDKLEQRVHELESRIDDGVETQADSLKEFVNRTDPDGHDDIVLAIGYYLESIEGKQGFSASDLKDSYKRAKRQPYSNISVLTSRMTDKGHIMVYSSENNKKTYTLTAKGEEKIEGVLQDE